MRSRKLRTVSAGVCVSLLLWLPFVVNAPLVLPFGIISLIVVRLFILFLFLIISNRFLSLMFMGVDVVVCCTGSDCDDWGVVVLLF